MTDTSTALDMSTLLARCSACGLRSIAAARALLYIHDQGSPTIGAIASHVGRAGAALTQSVDRLERAGLVRRARSIGDRRVIRIELTLAGRDVVTQLLAA
jgi:DNA-binding MarR family transcriptional regulator